MPATLFSKSTSLRNPGPQAPRPRPLPPAGLARPPLPASGPGARGFRCHGGSSAWQSVRRRQAPPCGAAGSAAGDVTAGAAGLPRASCQLACRCPQSSPMAGSGCAWGAEPPRFLEAFGRLWQVQSRLGSGSSASVYRVRCCGTPGSPPGALKQFLPPGTTGAAASAAEYGFRKERAALERLQGHRNIGNCRCPPSLLARVPGQHAPRLSPAEGAVPPSRHPSRAPFPSPFHSITVCSPWSWCSALPSVT